MKFTKFTLAAYSLETVSATLRGDAGRNLATVYYPKYTDDLQTGYCTTNNKDARGAAGVSTELQCCKQYFINQGQSSGMCYSMLPAPPTVAPSPDGGYDIWYADYKTAQEDATCINKAPAPIGRVTYDSQLKCCKVEYATQTSGACVAQLPTPPTAAPSPDGGYEIWYADYDTDFADATCINKHPSPLGRVTYDSQLECCKDEYATQTSGACLQQLPNPPTAAPSPDGGYDIWYADYDTDFADATCINKAPAPLGRVTYDSQLECCKDEYATQTSGACVAQLPTPPTAAPSPDGGYEIWYPDYELDWAEGVCINKHPAPNGRKTYDSQLECCKNAYGSQLSGACLNSLPAGERPTTAPTGSDGPNIWYADYDLDWAEGKCTNKGPVPNGRVTYDTQLECCKSQYPAQSSGACLSDLPSAPTAAPSPDGGYEIWYADFDKDWAEGVCINKQPVPNGRNTYDSQLECCQAQYGTQLSGACLNNLPAAERPTTSPTGENGPDAWYPDYDLDWAEGECINKAPVPQGRLTYPTELECCKKAYSGQASGACLASLPSPPTASPVGSNSLFFPIWKTWDTNICDNDPTKITPGTSYFYETKEECCNTWFKDQETRACLRFDPKYGTLSPTQAPVQ